MPVTITVSEVRDALYRAAGSQSARGTGAPSLAVLGQWFHDAVGWMVTEVSGVTPLAVLADVDENLDVWKRTLIDHAYAHFVGPRLTSHQAALQEVATQVLTFWQAMQAACQWLAELAWSLRPTRKSSRMAVPAPWQSLAAWLTTEEPLSCELREPGWIDSVRLVGIADAVVRLNSSGNVWCAIEFKIGQTSPTADLGQACLYHLMLSAAETSRSTEGTSTDATLDSGTLALISFRPDRHEQLFDAATLQTARQRLVDLIGKLAGVDATQANPPETRSAPVTRSTRREEPVPAAETRPAGLPYVRPTEEHLRLGQYLVTTLTQEYGVTVSLDGPPLVGPSFLRFPIRLGPRMKVAAVQQRVEELQLRLGLSRPPFIAIEEGMLVVDVQRPDRQKVLFDDVRSQLPAPDARLGGSHVPIGVDIAGQLVCANLATTEHAHLLAAGTTGSGKSEWLRTAIAGLIVTNTPETLRLLIIDPKRNAFHALRRSPFLWKPLVFPDEQPTAVVLKELVDEMDRRYRQLDGADSHAQLVARSDVPLPRIVCVCDEYRDLISRSREERKQIEDQICRLGAKARAAGIHLILATQEPRRETIKGPLDSNIPARVGLWMQKAQESRMLLSEPGAEKLLGHGDLLFKDVGRPRRLQSPLLSEANRDSIFGS
ncbi:MAG: DNA translocase FtsK [Planctomycetes bacterium]|nr:DNA translocase FtsK [Planctomycetota bacterium]